MNPLLPRSAFVPDVEARAMPDGRLYLYGSWDISGSNAFCSEVYHVFSSDDMQTWVDHGVSFSAKALGQPVSLYAPDCIFAKGRYWLYYCTSSSGEGVAVADTPCGPFTDCGPIEGANGDSIDPAVFVDDDGQAYYFWGQFELRGARLESDMRTLDKSSIRHNILTEHEHGFHEGASIRKRGNLYYLVYTDISRGRATCMGYAYSHSPLGPYTKGGIILDNTGCDPKSWNNHGSIAEYKGQWYIFYHRSSQNSVASRRVCLEPITFDEAGRIGEVPMTSRGCGDPLDGSRSVEAALACRMKTPFSGAQAGIHIAVENGREILKNVNAMDWAEYRTVRIPVCAQVLRLTARVRSPGMLHFYTDNSRLLSTVSLVPFEAWREYTAPMLFSPGEECTIWLHCMGSGDICDIESFIFI